VISRDIARIERSGLRDTRWLFRAEVLSKCVEFSGHSLDPANSAKNFLTRVTRIFEKRVFTETAPEARAGLPRRVFSCATAPAAARGGFLVFAKKQENTGEKVMSFQKGESGNPAGRPRGARNRATLLMQNLLANDAEAIGRKAIEMAKAGDLAAIRLCMDRLTPARKDEPVAFELPPIEKAADSVAATASIVAAVAAGELTPSQAAELSKVIDVYLRALENKGFDERLTKLENEQKLRSAP
jgi:hypothetical protein